MGLKNNGPRNLMYLCVFYAFCTFDFNKSRGFGHFVVKSPVPTDLVIGVFHMANIVIRVWQEISSQNKAFTKYQITM